MSLQIIRHAFAMIFGNLGQALRVSVGPYLLLIVFFYGAFKTLGISAGLDLLASGGRVPADQVGFSGGAVIFSVLALLIATLFVASWVAVSWHRFILLEEYSGLLPATAGRPIWPYIGRTLLCALIIFMAAIGGLLIILGASAVSPIVGLIAEYVVTVVLSVIWFRIGVSLPSIAVGQPVAVRDAWSATSPFSGVIVGIVMIILVISFVVNIATQGLYDLSPMLGLVVNIFIQWVTLMVGVSVLTTLYGHLIEGRPLID
ncbi:hypothetical protein [Yoonia maritima]|uniref:hypothetical protein n=1 Tax=Yoonia maritima TaxID=1435347 RepID=UPI0013A65FFF|nr:hypothetical protein [Yoonia maritima]